MGKKYSFDEFCEYVKEYSPCMDDYPYVIDIKEDKYYISEKATERFAVPSSLFSNVTETHKFFVYPDDIKILEEDLQKLLSGQKDTHNIDYRWLSKDNEPVWINCRGRVLKDENGQPSFMIGCVNEIGRVAKADNLSGLKQSTALKEILSNDEEASKINCFLRIGVDGFKGINEKFGIDYGDKILQGVAKCILDNLKKGYQAFHVVSDEYIITAPRNCDVEDLHDLYREIRKSVDRIIEKNNYEALYTISGGIINYSDVENHEYGAMMRLSQFALSEAKTRGKNQVYIFQTEDYERFLRSRNILVILRKAVEENFSGFDLFFQPIMTAEKNGVAKLYAAESLLRFTTPEGERISPMEFIPILEESGLIIPVGKWILDKAASMCRECQKVYPDFKITVNLSYVQILKSAILNEVFNVIAKHSLKPESLVMEMTESGYLEDTPAVRRVWNSLKKFGVLIAIDDFGTGYSNLTSISKLTPDIVKLDRGFTVKALENIYENQLMEHVIQLVHSIDLKICIEGIETRDDLDRLSPMGANYIQGYYYSKPCSKDEFLEKFVYIK